MLVNGYVLEQSRDSISHTEAEKNGRHFADDIFKCIFLNENFWIPIQIWLKLGPKGPINISSIGSDDGLAPTRRQAIFWTNAG